MAKKSTIITNWPKFLLQWGSLALLAVLIVAFKMDPEKYCPMGGLQAFVTYIVRGSLPCSMTTVSIVMGLALAAAVILLSKLFCAFICPIGTIEDLLTKLREACHIKGIDIKVGSIADKVLRIVKYAMLFWIFYMTATASELFCKNLDPYYAVATGFKGEITLWMSITTLSLVVVCGFFIKRFWCRYICPLGAASNTLKFWYWLALLGVAYWLLTLVGVTISWITLLAAFCIMGYVLEIVNGKPKAQTMYVLRNDDLCGKSCHSCMKACPYAIDAPAFDGKIASVDCTLCGECVAACPTKALSIGCSTKQKKECKAGRFIPAIIAVVLIVAGVIIGKKWELPTINETWDITEDMELETLKVENLKSVKCYGSSMAFKARLEGMRGIHGVKTYVGSHTVVISYDPKRTNEARILEEIYVPANYRIKRPDPEQLSELKVYTIRTEKMADRADLINLGLQFRLTDKEIYGVESEYDCPLIVRIFTDPAEELEESWLKEIVEKETLDMPTAKGTIKQTPCGFRFVKMEKGTKTISVSDFLHNMLNEFTAEVNGKYEQADTTVVMKRKDYYAGQPQKVIEIVGEGYEKPLIKRYLPFASNTLSKHEGLIGVYVRLNKKLQTCLYIRYAGPMTSEQIWEILDADTWTITYSADDVREEPARLQFNDKGTVYDYDPEIFEF